MKYEFEKKPLDKGIFSWKFNVRYWLLKKLGLNGYTGFIAIVVAIFTTIIIYELILP